MHTTRMIEPRERRGRRARSLGLSLALGLAAAGLLPSCASSAPSPAAQEWYELGNAWLDKGEWKRAGQAYSRALALEPAFAEAEALLVERFAQVTLARLAADFSTRAAAWRAQHKDHSHA